MWRRYLVSAIVAWLAKQRKYVGGALVLAAGLAVVLLTPSETVVAEAPAGVGSAHE